MGNAETEMLRLRNFTERTGVLTEAQVHQLRLWLLASSGKDFFKDYEIGWDFENKVVEYKLLDADLRKAPKNCEKRFKVLDESVKWLLGPEYIVRIKSGRKVLFKGQPRKEEDE